MLYQLAIAIGSGLASAVLFLVPAKGSMAALFIGVLAPLPLMIATLGFGPRSAGLAAVTGTVTIAAVLHPYLAGAFAFSVVVPAILLGWQTQRRSAVTGARSRPFGAGGVLSAPASSTGSRMPTTTTPSSPT